MKIKSLVIGLSTALGFAAAAVAQTTTINIVGATAFRSAADAAIKAAFTESGALGSTWSYAHSGNATKSGGASRAIYRGNFPGITGTTIIRTAWSGSVEGVRSLVKGTASPVADTFLTVGAITAPGENFDKTSPTEDLKGAATFAFSDVAQKNTPFTSPTINGGPVGVIAFAPVINKDANASITNITIQQLRQLIAAGTIPTSMLTGSTNDGTIYNVGRNDGSGTRVVLLSETGVGAANAVKQYVIDSTKSSETLSTPVLAPLTTDGTLYPSYTLSTDFATTAKLGNGGYSSGGTIAGWMKKASAANYNIVSWLGTNDAVTSQNFVSGVATGGRVLSYNGEKLNGVAAGAFSSDDKAKIAFGKYSGWSFENLFYKGTLSANTKKVYDKLVAVLPANLGTAGATIAEMKVTRTTDGGVIAPK